MSIFAIGDLHLPGGGVKPMDVFGAHWQNHFARISADWRARVREEDTVLLPGDISWAMQLGEALGDLRAIDALPGRKLLLRGNHDYWWSSLTQLRAQLPAGMAVIQNDAVDGGACVFCGTRGWTIPTAATTAQDEKLYQREALRLEMSLREAARMAQGRPLFAMMHYPPLTLETLRTGTRFTELLSAYGVARCVYGHLHGASVQRAFGGVYRGVRYDLVSCDALGFVLKDVSLTDGDAHAASHDALKNEGLPD